MVSTFQLCKNKRTKKPWWRVYKGIEMWARVDALTGVCEGLGKWGSAVHVLFKKEKASSKQQAREKPILSGRILTGYKWSKFAPFWDWESSIALIERQDDENSSPLEGSHILEMLDRPGVGKASIKGSGDWHELKLAPSWNQIGWWHFLEKVWKERLRIMVLPCLVLGDS